MRLVASDGLAKLINKQGALPYSQRLTVTESPSGRPKAGPHQPLPSPYTSVMWASARHERGGRTLMNAFGVTRPRTRACRRRESRRESRCGQRGQRGQWGGAFAFTLTFWCCTAFLHQAIKLFL